MEAITIETSSSVEIIDITPRVEAAVDNGYTGICHVFVRHTTCGLALNEAESRLLDDMVGLLESLVPENDGYRHDNLDGNADAHLRSMLLSPSVSIPVKDGDLALGTWQSVLLFEGDGPRRREITVSLID